MLTVLGDFSFLASSYALAAFSMSSLHVHVDDSAIAFALNARGRSSLGSSDGGGGLIMCIVVSIAYSALKQGVGL